MTNHNSVVNIKACLKKPKNKKPVLKMFEQKQKLKRQIINISYDIEL